ncbi:hypothetical protein OCK72_06265 [Fusobacterium simiae]|uniref:DUF2628 domain-containing protein n=1 Tax=Fusobacterium simiae TaxID=855 RepID=A0ABT4DI24_FUSSI|nr:hypothetical protein [Fusobacterium simiae]MCY7008260.1 hypothetical protein [Fusobacterium simiae]
MAVKVRLEKDGFVKDGFVGFSWTSLFFNVWVPAFRLNFDGFIIFCIISLIETILPIFIMITIIHTQNIDNLSSIPILQFSFYIVNFIVGFWYNRYYTQKMLKDGWKLLENDDYSSAILKGYRYLDYTESEIADQEKMQRYTEFLAEAKRKERNKLIFFLLFFVLIICLAIFF